MAEPLICCYLEGDSEDAKGCGVNADFEIIDLDDLRTDGSPITHACETHVGQLLGHALGWMGRGGQGWQVVPINPI